MVANTGHLPRLAVPPLRRREGPVAAAARSRWPASTRWWFAPRGARYPGGRSRAPSRGATCAARRCSFGPAGTCTGARRRTSRATRFSPARPPSTCVASGAALVGIDSLNIDDIRDAARPVHSILLGAGIPIVEHLCNLGPLPESGFRFSAVPAKVAGFGSWPVRAFASCKPPPMSYRQTTVSGFPAIALRSDEIEVVVVPAVGMQAHQPAPAARAGVALAQRPAAARAASSRCAVRRRRPTAADGTSAFRRSRRRRFPAPARDAHRCRITASSGARTGPARCTTTQEGTTLASTASGTRLPYELHREVTLDRGRAHGPLPIPSPAPRRRAVPVDLVAAPAVQRAAGNDARAPRHPPGQAGRRAWSRRPGP